MIDETRWTEQGPWRRTDRIITERVITPPMGEVLGVMDRSTGARDTSRLAMADKIVEAAKLSPDQARVARTMAIVKDEMDRKGAALSALLQGRPGAKAYPSLHVAYRDIEGDRAADHPAVHKRMLMALDGVGVRSMTEAISTSTWGALLGEAVNKAVIEAFAAHPLVAAARTLISHEWFGRDFRSLVVGQMPGYGQLPTVAQGAPFQPLVAGTAPELTTVPGATKRGGYDDITLEAMANDDVAAFSQVLVKLGRSAANTYARTILDVLVSNPTMSDTFALFSAQHSNTATSALSASALATAKKALRKSAALGDTTDLPNTPRTLLVAADLEDVALALVTSSPLTAAQSGQAAATTVPIARPTEWSSDPSVPPALRVVPVNYWSSTTSWFLAADGSTTPLLGVSYTRRDSLPRLLIGQNDTEGGMFAADKLTARIDHAFAVAPLDHRAMYRGNV